MTVIAKPQVDHEFLVKPSHDELARQTYASNLRMYTLATIGGGMRTVYDRRVKPAFEKANGRPPKDEHDVRRVMMKDPYCRTWSTMMRAAQEMVWESVVPTVERAQPELNARIENVMSMPGRNKMGSVSLDPTIVKPRYATAVDIHLMPGNYETERTPNDASQGAFYDRGVYVYQGGMGGDNCHGIGMSLATFIKRKFPDLKPQKILDVGCTVGHNLVPFVDLFPEAEIHGVDMSAPVMRYAHARAEAMGKAVHYHQMNAENMAFPDNTFDVVTSVILFHETSRTALRKIIKECRRVLKPGGLMLHMELPRTAGMDPYDAFYLDWDAYYNNEPFYQAYTSTDMKEVIVGAGFAPDKYVEYLIPDLVWCDPAEFDAAVRGDLERGNALARWGESIKWSTYGAWK